MITTPTLWPEGTVPSADQFAEWLTRLTRPELVEVTGRLLSQANTAYQCFVEDHAGRIADLTAQLRNQPNEGKPPCSTHCCCT